MAKVIGIIRDEHRSIAEILQGMEYLLKEIREQGAKVDTRIFWAMLYYLDTFAERLHHPKEDHFLFRMLKERTGETDDVISDLESEHAHGAERIKNLERSLARYQEGGDREFPAFAEAVDQFIRGYWEHMRREEQIVLPVAEKALLAADWDEIDRAFEENRDPLASGREERNVQNLYTRILNLAPPPIGVGPALSR